MYFVTFYVVFSEMDRASYPFISYYVGETGCTLVPTLISYFVCYLCHARIVGLLYEQCALISLSSLKCWSTPRIYILVHTNWQKLISL